MTIININYYQISMIIYSHGNPSRKIMLIQNKSVRKQKSKGIYIGWEVAAGSVFNVSRRPPFVDKNFSSIFSFLCIFMK